MYFSVFLSLVLSIGLFMLLPTWISGLVINLFGNIEWIRSIIEGLLRMLIFLGYLFLVSKMKDIRRIFEYHGAEHKTINCYENGKELSVENVRTHTRLHKRCGTSFLLIVMVVSMVVFFFLPVRIFWLRLLSRVLLVPVIAGISYELIMWAGRSKSPFVSIFSAPGMWLQRITTGEPDDSQIEVAIEALYGVLEDDGILERPRCAELRADETDNSGDKDSGTGCAGTDDACGEAVEDRACDEERLDAAPGSGDGIPADAE
jgi:uncharacterized protein YqhQ